MIIKHIGLDLAKQAPRKTKYRKYNFWNRLIMWITKGPHPDTVAEFTDRDTMEALGWRIAQM